MARGRQLQAPGPRQFQQQSSADHVAECAVGLLPPPGFAHPQGKLPPIGVGILGDQLTDIFHFRRCDHPASIAKFSFHAPERNRDEIRTQAPSAIFSQLTTFTGRHAGAAWVAVGSPAVNNTCS
jgi:hypothetical protein